MAVKVRQHKGKWWLFIDCQGRYEPSGAPDADEWRTAQCRPRLCVTTPGVLQLHAG